MHATLLHDSVTEPVFSGSCAVVAHYLRKSLEELGYEVTERSVPLSDKTGRIEVPPMAGDPAKNVRVIFEELFVRCADTPDFRATKNVSFFNLMATPEMAKQANADLVLMNSRFMAEALPVQLALRGVRCPPTSWVPMPLPLFDFPRGYPNLGGSVDEADLRALRRETHLGHAVRAHKMDCFATLSILHHLDALAFRRQTKPFALVVAQADYERCAREIAKVPVSSDVLEALVPVPHLRNESMVRVMKHAAFGLCYDDIVEAYGYYPVESVFLGCPVFTNGVGNLRHLLPRGHGIKVNESIAMHFGTPEERRDAYRPVALAIARTVAGGARIDVCARGKAWLTAHHQPRHFTHAFGRRLRAMFAGSSRLRPRPPRLRPSPYLRLADWERGHFVTDMGPVSEEPRRARRWKAALDAGGSFGTAELDALDHRVLCTSTSR